MLINQIPADQPQPQGQQPTQETGKQNLEYPLMATNQILWDKLRFNNGSFEI
eukprot:Pgem_evm1s20175